MSNKLSRISVILYTVRSSPLPYADKLKKLRDMGYRSIQGGFVSDMTNEEHKKLLDGLGMEMSCFGSSIEELQKDPGRFIEGCHYFDCDEIMIGTMPTEMRESYDGYMRAIELMNSVGRELKKGGVYLGYHNHAQEFRKFGKMISTIPMKMHNSYDGNMKAIELKKDGLSLGYYHNNDQGFYQEFRKFGNGKTGMDLLYENLDPDSVHFLLDTHWVQSGGGDIIQWLQKCKGRIQYLHVKDYRIAPANYTTDIGAAEKQFAQIGDGNLPWQLIIDTALSVGVKAFIVEQDYSYDQDPFDCVAESFRTLKECGLE